MKRTMAGDSARGPVAATRQRRTIRFIQMLLVVIAAALLLFAGYSWGRMSGYEDGRNASEIDAPSRPSAVQVVVLSLLGAAALGSAVLLQGRDGLVRMPTPARLDELAGRAEGAAVERAEAAAQSSSEAKTAETPPEQI